MEAASVVARHGYQGGLKIQGSSVTRSGRDFSVSTASDHPTGLWGGTLVPS